MSTPKSATIHYEVQPTKPTIVAHGGYGGPTPDGTSIGIHLYAESAPIPSVEDVELDPTGTPTSTKVVTPGQVRREVQATLILTPEGAVQIGSWLVRHGQSCLNRRKGTE